tara:strand:+ start:49 stop:642 length:594 start_codon:yes stop_codon:yes gene_type:complete
LSFRIEDKLYIKNENLIDFKNFLNTNSCKGLHEPRIIESLYFDNDKLQTYNDSIEGMVPRKKIRIRNYPLSNDQNFYYEIKNSSVEGRFKTRKIIDKKTFEEFKKMGIFDEQYGVCTPKLYVKYYREYFIVKDVRISIDTKIEYRDYKTNFQISDNRIIAELKASKNKDADELTKDFPIQRIRFSKYCFGLEKLFHL